jgi:hypothetical protein
LPLIDLVKLREGFIVLSCKVSCTLTTHGCSKEVDLSVPTVPARISTANVSKDPSQDLVAD